MRMPTLHERIGTVGDESGLTIIEVLVAAVILVLGSAATFGIFGAATKNAQRAKATQVALDLAQEELERLHGIPYSSLALNSLPQESSSSLNPGYRVSGETFALKRNPREEFRELDVDPENGVGPESEFVTGESDRSGITGTLYRYVVWRDDPTCPEEACPGTHDYKQIVVAVQPDRAVSQGGEAGYVEVQSKVTDPESVEPEGGEEEPEEEVEPEPDPEGEVTAQQFYLSDTPCDESGATERVEPVEDHLLHNTLGTCASGLKTGNAEPGAPDALLLGVPPDPAPEDDSLPVLHDYSDDFYLEPTPDTDRGVQIRRDDTTGCHYDPTGATNPESQVHRWVSDPMASAFEMGGRVTLEFYTRTLNDAIYKGALCVFLFNRSEAGSPPVATDTLLTDAGTEKPYWLYVPEGNAYWPRNFWTKVRVNMEFEGAPHFIASGDRLGVALGVERAGTPADAIPIMYDHPNYPTRLEVDTSTPIEGG
jgi:hypothetical protein